MVGNEESSHGENTNAKEGEVLPKEADTTAAIQRDTAAIRAVGEQIKAIVETPGVVEYLSGLGRSMLETASASQAAQKMAHELAMERERNGAASRRRIEIITAIWVPFLVLLAAASLFTLVWMIHTELITRNDAVNVGFALAALFTFFFKKTNDEKKHAG